MPGLAHRRGLVCTPQLNPGRLYKPAPHSLKALKRTAESPAEWYGGVHVWATKLRVPRSPPQFRILFLLQGAVRPGVTPFQFVDLSEEQIRHEITVHVEAPLEFCFSVWAERLNYTEWFDLISEVRRALKP